MTTPNDAPEPQPDDRPPEAKATIDPKTAREIAEDDDTPG
jgi:hypothetical protein